MVCSGKPQDVAEFRTMTLTREVVYRDLRRPKRKMYLTGSKAGGPEPSKSYETKIPDICHELQGLVSAMWGFGLALMQCFLTLPCGFSPLLEWECIFCAIGYCKYVICFLALEWSQLTDCLESHKILDF